MTASGRCGGKVAEIMRGTELKMQSPQGSAILLQAGGVEAK